MAQINWRGAWGLVLIACISGCATSDRPQQLTSAMQASGTAGYELVASRFQSLRTGSLLRVIAKGAVTPTSINTLGVKNATTEAVDGLVSAAAAAGGRNIQRIGSTDLIVLEITRSDLESLLSTGRVSFVQPDDADSPSLDSALPVVRGAQAHAAGAAGLGQTVVVLDTGSEAGHFLFGGRVIDEACFSSTTASSTTVCPNGANVQVGQGAATPCDPAVQGCFHGTHVAGIAAGSGAGLSGSAPLANLIAIQVFSRFPQGVNQCNNPNGCALSFISDQIRALDYVLNVLSTRFPIASVNMSLGGGNHVSACPGDARAPQINALRARGIATVIASANDGFTNAIAAPACVPAAIAVGASDDSDVVANFSNSSADIDLMAPGVAIRSAIPGNRIGGAGGTSMASPMVSGAVASLQSFLLLDVPTVEAALRGTGLPINTLAAGIQRPRINIQAALQQVQTLVPTGDFVLMKDTWGDTGREPDPQSAGQPMHESPYIWIRNQRDCATSAHAHQNPEFGQFNYGCVKIQNAGRSQARGTLRLYMAAANLDGASNWTEIGSSVLTLPAQHTTIIELPWANLPAAGHYCLLARWQPESSSPSLDLPGGIVAAVTNSKHLVWRNVNIVDSNPQSLSSKIFFEPSAAGGTYNLAVDISKLTPHELQQLGELIIQLGGDPGNVSSEPTSKSYRYEGRWISIPLKPGVYYVPDIQRPKEGSTTTLEFVRRNLEQNGRDQPQLKIDILRVDSISEHKAGRGRTPVGVTYILRSP